jgi:hypothetical protein
MPVSPDISVFGKNQGYSDYQRANEEFARKKALADAQIQLAGAQAQKAAMPETITPYQAATLDLQKRALEQKDRPEVMTPYQAATLEMQRRRLELAMQKGGHYVDENGNIIQATTPTKPLPSSISKGILENRQNLKKSETALSLLEGDTVELGGQKIQGNKNAVGMKGYLPNAVLNYFDEKGVPTRAALADIGSMVIHDRSGAAVTASEYPRLAPFIPSASDRAEVAKSKMRNFVGTYRQLVDDGEIFYKESGYRVPSASANDVNLTRQPPATKQWKIEAID